MNRIKANGQEFCYLSAGTGPKVLLLHGFPDIPATWSFQMEALAQAGYCPIAPYLRGYHPNPIQAGAFYDKATLVQDLSCLIEALDGGEPLFFVGQDWGAIIGYALCAARPDLVKKAVLMAVPHPAIVATHLLTPKHVQRSFHWWFFQQADFPEKALMAEDMAFIDFLWRQWCAPGYEDREHIQAVKACLREPGVRDRLLAQLVAFVQRVRAMDLKKKPSAAETIDWARALTVLCEGDLDEAVVRETLGALLKYQGDLERVEGELGKLLAAPA